MTPAHPLLSETKVRQHESLSSQGQLRHLFHAWPRTAASHSPMPHARPPACVWRPRTKSCTREQEQACDHRPCPPPPTQHHHFPILPTGTVSLCVQAKRWLPKFLYILSSYLLSMERKRKITCVLHRQCETRGISKGNILLQALKWETNLPYSLPIHPWAKCVQAHKIKRKKAGKGHMVAVHL